MNIKGIALIAAIGLAAMSSVANAATCGGEPWTSEAFFAGKCIGNNGGDTNRATIETVKADKSLTGSFNVQPSETNLSGSFGGATASEGGLKGSF